MNEKKTYFFTCVVAAFTAVYTISGFHMAVNAPYNFYAR